ncbi:MAG: NADH-quinone oxidoreductase subunit C [Deltaproteobacteria bacterium]|nr:NADH-quinone oxidoreductase subunit C [Deltaproteobacteria bacterium]MBW2396187.1 NADH-quinone oxidoreductase subunit C [Deltaproteobacteria bacterium]
MTFLRDESALAFDMLTDLTCVDFLGSEPLGSETRFEMVYHLYSVARNHRLRIKAYPVGEPPTIASLTGLWASADWMEREVFDLYGIEFDDHPDLRRILLYEGFEGHPLRKDYPKTRRQPLIGPGSRGA